MNTTRKLVSFDWAIKRILRSKVNFVVVEGFLTSLLGQKVTIQDIIESETNQEHKDNKYNRVDMNVKTESGEIIMIEVQFSREYDYFHRMAYGVSKMLAEHFYKSEEYEHVRKIFSINIVYFELGHGDDYAYHGTTDFYGMHTNHRLELSATQKDLYQKEKVLDVFPEYYLLKINNFDDMAKDSLDEWIYFLKNEEIRPEFKAPGLKEAAEILDVLKLSPTERAQYEEEMENRSYEASITKSNFKAGRVEGIKIGIEKGEKIGIEKGKLQGKIEGKAEGEHLAKIEIAKVMVKKNLDIETISDLTGLTIEEIKKLI